MNISVITLELNAKEKQMLREAINKYHSYLFTNEEHEIVKAKVGKAIENAPDKQLQTPHSGFSYAVFSFVTDRTRSMTVPVGVVLWSSKKKWVKVRLLDSKQYFPYVQLLESDLQQYMAEGKLPYQSEEFAPTDDAWWLHLAKLLHHQIWLGYPKPIDCQHPEEELESLYKAVVTENLNEN